MSDAPKTLRDEFAMAALACIADQPLNHVPMATLCYRIADAMMEARKEKAA